MVGVLGKFANFMPQNMQQSIIRQASATSLGSWSYAGTTSMPAIHATLLGAGNNAGKILYVAGSGWNTGNENGPFKAAIFDPITNLETTTYTMTEDLFCCGFAQLANGNILAAGGTKDYDDGRNFPDLLWHGLKSAYEFDVTSSTFRKINSMAHGRWYPSMGILPNGKVFVMTGYDEYGIVNDLTEIYDPTFKTFSIKYDPTPQLSQSYTGTYCVGQGNTKVPGAGTPCYGGPNNAVNPTLKPYDRMIVMPSGLVLHAGQKNNMHLWNPTTGHWTKAGNMSESGRTYGASILLPLNNTTSERGRVLLCGGQRNNTKTDTTIVNTAELVNFNPPGTDLIPSISNAASMAYPRWFTLPVMLPTGQPVVFGGASNPDIPNPIFDYYPEMYDPANNTWTTLAPANVGRTYHSVAMVLPDGTVWTASGTPNETIFENKVEKYSPWYLSAGTRPTISGNPTVGNYGGTITIPTPDASSITSVSLLKLPNTTHHQDWEHRLIWLQIQSITSSSVIVSAPINANLAPPGYYLIHVLKSSPDYPVPIGIPSVGKIIQIGSPAATGTDITPPTIGITSPSSRAVILGPASGVVVNVAGTASDSQSGVTSVQVSIDGGPSSQATPVAPGDWSIWTFSTNINQMGPHTIQAIATDNAGNKASVKIPVTVFL